MKAWYVGRARMRIERQLNPGHLDALRLLIGESLHSLYAEGLDASPNSCVAPYYVHRLGGDRLGQFVVIQSDWRDTLDEAIDYHEMIVSVEDRPRGIPWTFNTGDGPGTIGWPYSRFEVIPRIIVESVSVWERAEAGEADSVLYDAAIIFHGSDSREVAVCAHESITGGVEASSDPATIEELKHDCALRLRLA